MTTSGPDVAGLPEPKGRWAASDKDAAWRRVVYRSFDWLTCGSAYAGAIAIVASLAALIAVLLYQGWPAIIKFNVGFFTSTNWDPGEGSYGALVFVFGTLVSSFLALLIAVPVSIGSAIFLIRLAPRWLVTPASFLIEVLAAIPSITFGLWGRLVLTPQLQAFQRNVQPTLKTVLAPIHIGGYSPYDLFSGPAYGTSMLAGALILALMITPVITAITRDVLRTVPKELEEGAYGLGATWWQATKVILGYAKMGIFGAAVLGLARALGETMAVTMVIGNTNTLKASLFAPGQTMASLLANEFIEADKPLYVQSLIYIAALLLLVTTLINGAARMLIWQSTRPRRPKAAKH